MAHNPLGQQTDYVSRYAPELLFPIARADSRLLLDLQGDLPFHGADLRTGYELSWLNPQGKPQVAVAEFVLPCTSEFMVESKSFKLYLNSFNQTHIADKTQLRAMLVRDLSAVVGAAVEVRIGDLDEGSGALAKIQPLPGVCLDQLPIQVDTYHPHPDYLQSAAAQGQITESVFSHLLKTNCPVTGQPDWASVQISYTGAPISHEGLLRYLISFREHQDFHEHCVERIFMDVLTRCKPERLTVYARYTRRGGLDINPLRTTEADYVLETRRLLRQ